MVDIPEREPLELVVGDRWQWKRTDLSDYPASTWTLTYYFVQLSGTTPANFSIIATADGDDFSVDESPATTAAFTAGDYRFAAYVDQTGDRVEIAKGTIVLKPNLETDTSDPRTYSEKVLDAINAVIEGRASQTDLSYSINNRSLSRIPHEELLVLKDRFERNVANERREERRELGRGTRNKIKTRFTG